MNRNDTFSPARCFLLSIGLAITPVLAQAGQIGDADRDYEINSLGRGARSVVDSILVPGFEMLENRYQTSAPGAPVLWAGANESTTDWLPGLATNSLDLGPAGLVPLFDGWGPGLFAQFLRTDATGLFELSLVMDPGLPGTELYVAMAHLTAITPDGFLVSQTHRLAFRSEPGFPPIPGEVVIDTATVLFNVMPLGFSFPFYGANYTELNLAVAVPGLELGGNQGSMTPWGVNPFIDSWPNPVIYPYAIPASNPPGSVTFFSNGVDAAVVTWNGARGGSGFGEIFTRVILSNAPPAPTIQFDYGALVPTGAFTSNLILVGLNPGTAQIAAPQAVPLDLTAGPTTFTSPDVVPFEVFRQGAQVLSNGTVIPSRVSDLRFTSIGWVLDAQGFPVAQM